MQPFITMEPVSAYTSKYRLRRSGDVPSAKINIPDVATKTSLPRAAELLDAVADESVEAIFESTTVTVAPAPTSNAPPLEDAEFAKNLQVARNTELESV